MDSVQRQVENLQTLQILQPFNRLQMVPPLDTERKEDPFKEKEYVTLMKRRSYISGFQPGLLIYIQLVIPAI